MILSKGMSFSLDAAFLNGIKLLVPQTKTSLPRFLKNFAKKLTRAHAALGEGIGCAKTNNILTFFLPSLEEL